MSPGESVAQPKSLEIDTNVLDGVGPVWADLTTTQRGRMATPGQLVTTISEATGIAYGTVRSYDRFLAIGGLRSTSGRGIAAAQVTARDAAYLLVAILGSHEIREAAQTVERYGDATPMREAKAAMGYRASGIHYLERLPAIHSFPSAVEALIAQAHNALTADCEYPELVEITALSPGVHGEIRLAGLNNQSVATVRYGVEQAIAKKVPRNSTRVNEEPDFRISRRITDRTIWSIARLLTAKKAGA